MSYLVLARKYRPRTFTELVGQEHVVQALANALTQQRLHHAYLFTGTRGVGKTTVSRILAKSLNCTGADGQGGITATPCGVCPACRDIDSGRFPDYTELDAASNRGVDEIQSLLEQAVYKPVQGRFKVFMIDEVHMMTNHAFNAMLKTLEEPPEYLKFVLATTDPQKVPVTVLSRCLQFNLRPMAPDTVMSHLAHVLQAEGVSAEPQALRLLSRAARGSMRDALSLTDQAIAFGSGQLQEEPVRQMLGAVDRTYVLRLIEALAAGDGRTVVEMSDTLRLNGLSAASTLEEMSGVLQRMAVHQAVPDLQPEASDPEATEIARLAQVMPPDETQLLYSLCLHGRGELGLAPDEYAALTMTLLRLLAFKPAGVAGPAEKKTLLKADAPATRPVPGLASAPAVPAQPASSDRPPGASGESVSPVPSMPPTAVHEAKNEAKNEAKTSPDPAVSVAETAALRPPVPAPAPVRAPVSVPAPVPASAAPPAGEVVPEAETGIEAETLAATTAAPVPTLAGMGPATAAARAASVEAPPAPAMALAQPVESAETIPAPATPRAPAMPLAVSGPGAASARPGAQRTAAAPAVPAAAREAAPWDDAEAASWQSMADGWAGAGSAGVSIDAATGADATDADDGGPPPENARSSAHRAQVLSIPVREQTGPGARTEQKVARAPQADVPPPELVPTPEGEFWAGLVESLCQTKAVTAMVRQLAVQSQLVARDEGVWHLRVESQSLASPALRERLRNALADAGQAVDLQVEVGVVKDSPARRQALARAEQLEAARQRIMADPFVQAMFRDFDARIVPGSIGPDDGEPDAPPSDA